MDYYRITPQELGQDARIPILKLEIGRAHV